MTNQVNDQPTNDGHHRWTRAGAIVRCAACGHTIDVTGGDMFGVDLVTMDILAGPDPCRPKAS